MKIVQINVWQGRIFDPLLAFLRDEKPDIVFAQEIFSYPHPIIGSSAWKQFRTLEQITEQGGFMHVYFALSTTFPMFGEELSYGNAILSKYPFTHTFTRYTAGPGPVHVDNPNTYDHNLTRNFQHAIIDTGRTKLNLINHHGHWVNHPLGDAQSTVRLQIVADYITGLEGPTLAGGDLNLSPTSPAIRKFAETTGLRDVLSSTSPEGTLSAAHFMNESIFCDYLFASPELKITHTSVSDNLVSDHKALVIEIDC